jgi:feruloyl esterase
MFMKNRLSVTVLACLCSAAFVSQAQSQPDSNCTKLAKLSLPDAKITQAALVAPGAFLPPGKPDPKDAATYKSVPAFCRATIQATPSADSDIQIEVWLPASGWNGKFKGVGNGGFAGYIDYGALATNLKQGYATASTDTGHQGGDDPAVDAKWALGHPEKIADFGYRAIHVMTVDAKTVIDSFYGKPPARAYFASCSNGGPRG